MLPDMVINWDRLIWNNENDNPLYYLRAILFVSEVWYRLMFMEYGFFEDRYMEICYEFCPIFFQGIEKG